MRRGELDDISLACVPVASGTPLYALSSERETFMLSELLGFPAFMMKKYTGGMART
jgi:hypothetical protein